MATTNQCLRYQRALLKRRKALKPTALRLLLARERRLGREALLTQELDGVLELLLEHTQEVRHCECKALTFYFPDGRAYSAQRVFVTRQFPGLLDALKHQGTLGLPIIAPETTATCPHCAEHLGFDLCGCGSGQLYATCSEVRPKCKTPIQKVGVHSAS